MKQQSLSINNARRKTSCIDEMDTLLNQIVEFKELINSTEDVSDPRFKQEYHLFKQHVEWVIEDLSASSYITSTDKNETSSKLTG